MDDESPHIVELVDENGETTEFEHLMTLEFDGRDYIILGVDAADGVTDVVIMRIDNDGNGDDIYSSDIPEDVHQAVFDRAMELIEENDDDERSSV